MDQKSLQEREITFIESAIDEELILAAESLLEANAIHGAPTVNAPNYWALTVKDQSFHYEVKVHLVKDKIKDYDCNCVKFLKGEMCSHVVCALQYVRKEQQLISARKAESGNKKGKRITSKGVVSQMNRLELAQFVLDYAKKDSLFKMLLSARQYEMLNYEEREALIDHSFPVLKTLNQKASAKSVNGFISFSEELSSVYTDFLSAQNYVDAYKLIFLLVKKSFYIKSKITKENARFLKNHVTLLELFKEITEIIEAPEFKEEINTQIIELITSSYITANLEEEKQIWIYLYQKKHIKEELRVIVKNLLKKGKGENEDLDSYYFFGTLDLMLTPDSEIKEKISNLDNQSKYRYIQTLMTLSAVPETSELLEKFILYTSVNTFLIKQVLEKITATSISAELENRLVELFAKHEDSYYLEWLKSKTDDLSQLEGRIELILSEYPSKDLIIQFKLMQDKPEEAIQVMEQNLDLDVIKKYDRTLIKSNAKEILSLYKTLCAQYMTTHFGPKSREYLISVYQHLDAINAEKLKKELQSFMKNEFSTRNSLKA